MGYKEVAAAKKRKQALANGGSAQALFGGGFSIGPISVGGRKGGVDLPGGNNFNTFQSYDPNHPAAFPEQGSAIGSWTGTPSEKSNIPTFGNFKWDPHTWMSGPANALGGMGGGGGADFITPANQYMRGDIPGSNDFTNADQFGMKYMQQNAGKYGNMGMDAYGNQNAALGNLSALGNQYNANGQQAFNNQNALIDQLKQQANGTGPGQQLAQNQFNQALNQQAGNTTASIGAARGINPALAAQIAGQQNAVNSQNGLANFANSSLQSRLAAQNQIGQLTGQQQSLYSPMGMGANQSVANAYGQQAGLYSPLSQQGYKDYGAQMLQSGYDRGQLGNQRFNTEVGGANAQTEAKAKMTGAGINAVGGLASSGALRKIGGGIMNWLDPQELGGGSDATSGGWAGEDAAGGAEAGGEGIMASRGALVPGRAKVKGNSPKNDTVPAELSPGEIVLPRSITEHPDAPHLAYEFVRKVLAGKGPKPKYVNGKRAAYDGSTPIGATELPEAPAGRVEGSTMPTDPDKQPTELPQDQSDYMNSVISGQQGYSAPMGSAPTGFAPTGPGDNPNLSLDPSTTPTPNGTGQPAYDPKTIADPYDKIEKAEQAKADATKAQFDQEAKAWDDYNTQIQKNQLDYQTRLKGLDTENSNLTQAVMNQKIDPDHFWHNQGTGETITSAIGILLSGIGSGMSGQPNMAMQVINNRIDKDMETQKMELGKKESLLSNNLAKYGRLDAANAATRAQLASITQGKIAKAASINGGAQAQQNAQIAIQQLELQKRQDMAKAAALSGNSNAADAAGGPNVDRLMALHSTGAINDATFKEAMTEAGKHRELKNAYDAVNTAFDDVARNQKIIRRGGSPLMSQREINTNSNVYAAYIAREADGKVNTASMDAAKEAFPQFGDDEALLAKKKVALNNLLKAKLGNGFPYLRATKSVDPNDPLMRLEGSALPGEKRLR